MLVPVSCRFSNDTCSCARRGAAGVDEHCVSLVWFDTEIKSDCADFQNLLCTRTATCSAAFDVQRYMQLGELGLFDFLIQNEDRNLVSVYSKNFHITG